MAYCPYNFVYPYLAIPLINIFADFVSYQSHFKYFNTVDEVNDTILEEAAKEAGSLDEGVEQNYENFLET